MHAHAQFAAHIAGGHVIIAAIAEQHHIGHRMLADQVAQGGGPICLGAAIIDAARQAPGGAVTAVEIHLVHAVAGTEQALVQATKQRPHQALQQQHAARRRRQAEGLSGRGVGHIRHQGRSRSAEPKPIQADDGACRQARAR